MVAKKETGDPISRYVSAGSQKALTEKLHREMGTYRGVDRTENSSLPRGGWLDQWLEELVDSGCCPVPEPAKDSWRYQSRRKGKVKC